jgi:hypothetical protein
VGFEYFLYRQNGRSRIRSGIFSALDLGFSPRSYDETFCTWAVAVAVICTNCKGN